jgi:hypothetical protein
MVSIKLPAAAWRVALLLCLTSTAAVAQAPSSIPLPWKVGTKLAYHSTLVNESTDKGVTLTGTERSDITIEVTQASDEGFVQVWREANTDFATTDTAPGVAADLETKKKLAAAMSDLGVEVELDSAGRFQRVRNWQALGERMRDVMRPMLRAQARSRPGAANLTDDDIDDRLELFLRFATGESSINGTLGKHPKQYNLFTAPAAAPGKPVRYEGAIESGVPGYRMPTVGMLELIATDEAADTVTLRWTEAVDTAREPAMVLEVAESMLGLAPSADRAAALKDLEMRDQADVVINRSTGVPMHLVRVRTLRLADRSERMTWTLELKARWKKGVREQLRLHAVGGGRDVDALAHGRMLLPARTRGTGITDRSGPRSARRRGPR